MSCRKLLVLSALLLPPSLLPLPTLAQPPQRPIGPWAADADGDGRITREEMRAWMEQRFRLMDPDGDGLVPVEAMQRMLGHERKEGEGAAGGQRQRHGGDAGEARHGRRGGFGGPGGHGGPPPGERPSPRQGAEGAPPGPPGTAMPYPEDSNDDGKIDMEEFVAPALAFFGEMDRNGDGVLTPDELPAPPRREEAAPQE